MKQQPNQPFTTDRDRHFFLAGWNGCALALNADAHLKNAAHSAPVQPAPAASTAPERWCPDECPITGREFFMWIEHWKTGQAVPTYGGPFDSYTIPVKDEHGTFSCERFDHDAGEWMTEGMGWCELDLKLADDQAFVVESSNPRYDEIRDFAEAPAADAHTQAARDVLAERQRQISEQDWTPEHDDEHVNDEIAAMACFYLMPDAARAWNASSTSYGATLGEAILPDGWYGKTGDRRRELVKGVALGLAEIERIDRATAAQEAPK